MSQRTELSQTREQTILEAGENWPVGRKERKQTAPIPQPRIPRNRGDIDGESTEFFPEAVE